mmetsp:Transcript_30380/g.81701  ORF Transcript_30380/g.81701 Transcript_30380/m.81701 type:complete len:224 (-) Transcript_30380:910-1581(-)
MTRVLFAWRSHRRGRARCSLVGGTTTLGATRRSWPSWSAGATRQEAASRLWARTRTRPHLSASPSPSTTEAVPSHSHSSQWSPTGAGSGTRGSTGTSALVAWFSRAPRTARCRSASSPCTSPCCACQPYAFTCRLQMRGRRSTPIRRRSSCPCSACPRCARTRTRLRLPTASSPVARSRSSSRSSRARSESRQRRLLLWTSPSSTPTRRPWAGRTASSSSAAA